MHILFFGTHPYAYNGYSIITYNLARQLSTMDNLKITVWGFQNFSPMANHMIERNLPANVFVYDSHVNEAPKSAGFGFDQVADFVSKLCPDVCVIYNDPCVITTVISKIQQIPEGKKKPRIISYFDAVYLAQKKEQIKIINAFSDYVICFTPYWQTQLKRCGIEKPMDYLQHGFDRMVNYPVTKELARQYYNIPMDAFVIMNLNRNQPRKRWDICMMAFAKFISMHRGENIKLLIATALTGAWNLIEVYECELSKYGISLDEGMRHLILIENPQHQTDFDVNVMYNVADVGINTCDGEGFGLCNFQQLAVGVPQIVSNVGGFKDFMDSECAILVNPTLTYYVDAGRDAVGGEAELCAFDGFTQALERYYTDRELMQRHGKNGREKIMEKYKWDQIAAKFVDICTGVVGVRNASQSIVTDTAPETPSQTAPIQRTKTISKRKTRLASIAARKSETDSARTIKELQDRIRMLEKLAKKGS